ncbi:hypothetical protein ACFX13_041234 [Malus domestica]
MVEDKVVGGEGDKKDVVAAAAPAVAKKKCQGIFSRMFSGIFRLHRDDFEKRLQYTWRCMTRHLILFSVFFERSSARNGGGSRRHHQIQPPRKEE